jgi:oxygen-independent coproporphyrinogen-3 oxidase
MIGLYIHIPFCTSKCYYCDFNSYAGKGSLSGSFFETLAREAEYYIQQGTFEKGVQTIFFGGGTPSLYPTEILNFLETFYPSFRVASHAEITLEANPGTVTGKKFEQLRDSSINRLSFGFQSFHPAILKKLGRIHSPEDSLKALRMARSVGFSNINGDLIFAIPGQTLEMWREDLEHLIALQPEHISTYNLTIEEGTKFGEWYTQGTFKMPDDDLQLAMYQLSIECLTKAGYQQYEISNFARPGFRSEHNQIYWRNEEYLGLGPGAFSYLGGRRFSNVRSIEDYTKKLLEGDSAVVEEEKITPGKQMVETLMMHLRLIEGISLDYFQNRFGISVTDIYPRTLEKLSQLRLLEIVDGRLRLTREGLYLANEVFMEFLEPEVS